MKSRIIQAFIEETRTNGIKFTMDDLAKRLGISKRTLYENFSSKLEILESIIDLTLEELEKRSRQISEDEMLSLKEKIQQTISIMPQYNEFFDLRILEQLKRYYFKQWERVDRELHQWDELKNLLEKGMESGLVKKQNIDLLMKLIIDAINITLDQKFFSDHSISVKEAMESITELLLYGLIKEE
ncbi:TetR/AcrR family transcriptional regulator [Planococcus sp. CPCC 101016]|uniref:TetR/AcrR family transcriptional regulator n=1 Tax=Planococcus sp. CPCC 101016 TaxID=2599617 RepID=UPI0011B7E5E5|nr:TetR/AcrR family transcriptional regulator [Planococcus sp. CPCC 101016]TWT05358.1 TetR/AcrR family transcriptional regulator [Planococcus sp. CPCC 101016]